MSLFDDQLADFREPHAPLTGRNSLTDHKRNFSSLLTQEGGGGGGALEKISTGMLVLLFWV